jgi:hypothetical protein
LLLVMGANEGAIHIPKLRLSHQGTPDILPSIIPYQDEGYPILTAERSKGKPDLSF